ncbi:oxidoreductase [Fulvivirga ulvae]|uniref:oxidoreductase n=1 Tax=Fulvivirga ulvae TaxID=2904245 RepID=UPI001F347E68|nr:oxidoreductase [Fulvivirga ulvae]UII34605.1 oxidoreductase [Fulvivirga ulvae]
MQNIKVGLIGYGMGGRVFHAPLIDHVTGLELVSIRETREENIKIAKSRYPQAEIVSDASLIINAPEIDLVVLAVPNSAHYSLAHAALSADKHVVVEKPFTVTSAEADELIKLANESQKVLSVYQNRRWDSDFLTVKKVLDSGKLGRLVEFESHFDRFRNFIKPGTWKEEGSLGTGLLYDLGSHLIDQAQVLFGLPEAVTCFMNVQRDNSHIIDNFELILHYSGIKVTIKSGMLVKEPLPKYILLGTQGSFVKYGLDVQEATLNEAEKSLEDQDWGQEPESQWGTINYQDEQGDHRETAESVNGNYPAYYENIFEAITGRSELQVTPQQGRNTIRIIELAMKSHEEQRTITYQA